MVNEEVRVLIFKKELKHYQIAQKLGIKESALSRMLNRTELSDRNRLAILKAIEELKGN